MSFHFKIAYLFALGLLRCQICSAEISVLESIARLMATSPSHSVWIPSVAYEDRSKNEYQQRQFDKDRQYERQVELILAEMQVQLLGTAEARTFFQKVSVYGLPSFDNLRFFDNYIASYDNRLKQPVWTIEYYYGKHMPKYRPLAPMRIYHFPDLSVHRFFRTEDTDYKQSAYFRGHLSTPYNVLTNPRILHQTFLSTNVAPMMRNIHRPDSIWDRVENYCSFISRRSKHVFIVTGTLHLPATENETTYKIVGGNRIAVPSHFYKVMLHKSKGGTMSIDAFKVPNAEGPDEYTRVQHMRVNITTELPEIERATGLKFYDLLDRASILKPHILKYNYRDRYPNNNVMF